MFVWLGPVVANMNSNVDVVAHVVGGCGGATLDVAAVVVVAVVVGVVVMVLV